MKKNVLSGIGSVLTLSVFLILAAGSAAVGAGPAEPVVDKEAYAIGVDAYIYFYPLITMDITRKQATNVELGKEIGRGPLNTFSNVSEYPPADFRMVVRPNFDTLYSSAWLDLTGEPMIVSAPDTDGRYYLLPMLDMWTDVFASPGKRTTGTGAADFAVVPPGWRGELPVGVQRIDAPTPYVWIIGRTQTNGPKDYDAVHKIQAGYRVTPLSLWGKPAESVAVKFDPTVDMKTPPKVQVDRMSTGTYFAYAANLLKRHPPHVTDQPIVARMKRIGIVPGKNFDIAKVKPAVKLALEKARWQARKLMEWKVATLAPVANGWSMNTDTMGVYGNYYLKRAIIAQYGLGANLPEDAIYPTNLVDNTDKPLDGANRYVIHFPADGLPPVSAFWSVTLYDPEGFPVANAIDRYAVSSWMPLRPNPDGSLDLYLQNGNPGPDKEPNWLPAPAGPFNLTMRLYAPQGEALTGKWVPPPVMRVD